MSVVFFCGFMLAGCVSIPAWTSDDGVETRTPLEFTHVHHHAVRERAHTDSFDPDLIKNDGYSFAIAAYDLNLDGLDDYFVYTSSVYACGGEGCALSIYRQPQRGKLERLPQDLVALQDIKVSSNRTGGMYDIILTKRDGKPVVWQWNGDVYEAVPEPEPDVSKDSAAEKAAKAEASYEDWKAGEGVWHGIHYNPR